MAARIAAVDPPLDGAYAAAEGTSAGFRRHNPFNVDHDGADAPGAALSRGKWPW
jgi:hypothetical protein